MHFFGVFMQVHFEAKRYGLARPRPRSCRTARIVAKLADADAARAADRLISGSRPTSRLHRHHVLHDRRAITPRHHGGASGASDALLGIALVGIVRELAVAAADDRARRRESSEADSSRPSRRRQVRARGRRRGGDRRHRHRRRDADRRRLQDLLHRHVGRRGRSPRRARRLLPAGWRRRRR